MLFFPGFLDFLDIWVFHPDVLTNLYFSADDVSGYLDFSAPFQMYLSIFSLYL